MKEFEERTGLKTKVNTVVFRNRLDQDAKIALYRIAQEALTNIERHAQATEVKVDLRGHKNGATLRITDNGRGIGGGRSAGLGLRNMQERVEQLDGQLIVRPAFREGPHPGTVIEATVPLSHLLPPSPDIKSKPKVSA